MVCRHQCLQALFTEQPVLPIHRFCNTIGIEDEQITRCDDDRALLQLDLVKHAQYRALRPQLLDVSAICPHPKRP